MQDFPLLLADLAPLVASAGLQNLTLQSECCARYGWHFSAHAFRGASALMLVHSFDGIATAGELREAITNALLDQLAAYYATAPQL
ncbi:hypothetical protein [Hymenobacter tenuis]